MLIINQKFDSHTSRLDTLTESEEKDRNDVKNIFEELDGKVSNLAEQFASDQRPLTQKIKEAVEEHLNQMGIGLGLTAPPKSSNSNMLARRSIHVWPLTEPTIEALRIFSSKYLQIPDAEFATFDVAKISVCRPNPQSKIEGEFCVEFSNVCLLYTSPSPRD